MFHGGPKTARFSCESLAPRHHSGMHVSAGFRWSPVVYIGASSASLSWSPVIRAETSRDQQRPAETTTNNYSVSVTHLMAIP